MSDINERVKLIANQHGVKILEPEFDSVMTKLNIIFPDYTDDAEVAKRLSAVVASHSELFAKPAHPEKVQGLDVQFVEYLAKRGLSIESFFGSRPALRLSFLQAFEKSVKDAGKPSNSEMERRRLAEIKNPSYAERARLAELNGIDIRVNKAKVGAR
jgi:hypothetical protein